MKQSGHSGAQPALSEAAQNNLKMYTLAATAAGVGVLALSPASEAKIVYTPSNIPIIVNGAIVELDLDHDGIKDFTLYNGYQGSMGQHTSELAADPAQTSNRILAVDSKGTLCAAAVRKGQKIGPQGRFEPGKSSMIMALASGGTTHKTSFGPWLKVKQAYLGFKFIIKGKVHFGWARIKMNGLGKENFVTGYAYETVVNKPILAGATRSSADAGTSKTEKASTGSQFARPSLGLLAMGSSGLTAWRRKQ